MMQLTQSPDILSSLREAAEKCYEERGDACPVQPGGDGPLSEKCQACPRTRSLYGRGPHLPPIRSLVVGQVGRKVNAANLALREGAELEYLPFLGLDGYIVKGWATLIAGYPKGGKTELITRLCQEWEDERILYITEEPESIWEARLRMLPGDWRHMNLLFALGMQPDDLLAHIADGEESVIVVDTVRNLLSLRDENDNSEVARVLGPYIAICRAGGKTLILSHHLRKGGGHYGEGITGGHAFLGIVDTALEILREPNLGEAKRKVRGFSRVVQIAELMYALNEDGSMEALGSPNAVQLETVKERVREALNGEWQTRKELLEALGEPRPGMEQLRLALNALVEKGFAQRVPQEDKAGATYRWRLCPAPGGEPNLPESLSMVVGEVWAPQEEIPF